MNAFRNDRFGDVRRSLWLLSLAIATGAALFASMLVLMQSSALAQQGFPSQSAPGTFPVRRPFGTGTDHTVALGIGDMDGDGDLDIVAGNRGERSSVAFNDGQGNFAREDLQFFGAMGNTTSLATGDLDGDGDLDVVEGYDDGSSVRYLNDGLGQLLQPEIITHPLAGCRPCQTSVALGDIDGNGYFDIVLARPLSETLVLLNDGAASVQMSRTLGIGSKGAQTVALGDVDDNGELDVLVAPNAGPATVFYQDTGDFSITRTLKITGEQMQVRSIALADFSGDGKLDVIVALAGTDPPYALYGNDGNRTFGKPIRLGAGMAQRWSLAVGDLTGDGVLDLGVGKGDFRSLDQVLLSPGTGGLLSKRTYEFGPPGQRTSAIAFADVNDDGFLDIVTGNDGFQNAIYLNGKYTGFSSTVLYEGDNDGTDDYGPNFTSVALGDIDGDGALDIVSTFLPEEKDFTPPLTGTIAVLINKGNNEFEAKPIEVPNNESWALALADFNGDGALDVAASDKRGDRRAIYLNARDESNRYGRFLTRRPLKLTNLTGQTGLAEEATISSVATGDLDGTNGIDLVMCSSWYGCSVYLNDGAVGPSDHLAFTLGDGTDPTSSVALADVNHDGRLDIVVGTAGEGNFVYLNDGKGRFPTNLRRPFGNGSELTWAISVSDVNGDSSPDILVGNFYESGAIYLNDGYGNFSNRLAQRFGNNRDRTYSIATGDVNGDGLVDFVTGNWALRVDASKPATNVLYLNEGGGSFVSTDLPDANYTRGIALGDMDGNGTLDVVEANRYGPHRLLTYSNRLRDSERVANGMATIAFTRPVMTQNASMLSSPQVLDTKPISLTFTLQDSESDAVGRVEVDYSSDGGDHWMPVRTLESITATRHLATSPAKTSHQITWDVASSDVFGRTDNMVLRIRAFSQPDPGSANPGTYLYRNSVPSLNQWPYVTATTSPFSVQGTGVVVISGTVPLRDALVYRLSQGQERGSEPIGGPARPFRTDVMGLLEGRAEIKAGRTVTDSDQLVAIWSSAEVTSTTPTRLYATTEPFTATYGSLVQSSLVISDARRIAAIDSWIDISATLPVSVELNLIPPNGDRIVLLHGLLPSGEPLCVPDASGSLPCGAAARRIFTPILGVPRNPLASGTWTLEASTPMTKPLQLQGWGLALKMSPLNFTSAEPVTTGLKADLVTGGLQTLVVSRTKPLLLFDLDVALEWDASNDEHYQTQLSADLRRASEILYDWTNGQVALGNVRVYHDARRNTLPNGTTAWNDAHVRIYATNRLRPNADQGGLISQAFSETVTLTSTDAISPPAVITHVITYLPGQVRMGTIWNRYGDATTGNLGEDWPAALAHELGHYLLFLDDNYLTLEDNLLVPLSDDECPGAMNNPYSNVYSEFHPDQGWSQRRCPDTLSNQSTGRSDWATIQRFYPWVIAPTSVFSQVMPGPSLMPLAVTQVTYQAPDPANDPLAYFKRLFGQPDETAQQVFDRLCRSTPASAASEAQKPSDLPELERVAPRAPDLRDLSSSVGISVTAPLLECRASITSTQPLEVPIFYLKGEWQDSAANSQARAFLFQGPPYPTVIDLGQPIGDQVVAVGARPGDRLCVYDLPDGKVGCESIIAGDDQLLMKQPAHWEPEIKISPDATSRHLTVTVNLPNVAANQALRLSGRLYPMSGRASDAVAMKQVQCTDKQCEYQTTLESDTPVLEGYVLVGEYRGRVGAVGTKPRQAITEFAIGGNPVRMRGMHSPTDPRSVRMRGMHVRMRGMHAPAASTDGQVMVYPDEEVLDPDKDEWSFTLQPATRLPKELPWATQVGRAYWLAASMEDKTAGFGRSSITFEYRRSDVPPGQQAFVRMYFWDQGQRSWRLLEGQKNYPEYSLISAPLAGAGLYALFSHYEIPLQPGWNLVGYPVQTSGVPAAARPISDVLASISGSYSAVYGYYPCDQTDPWKVFGPEVGSAGWVNDLQALDFGQGYWIHVTATEPITLNLRGPLTDTVDPLSPACPGTAADAAQRPPPTTFYGQVRGGGGFTPAAGLPVVAFVDGTVCGNGWTRNQDGAVVYSMTVEAASPENGFRCGSAGKQVTFRVDDREVGAAKRWDQSGLQAHTLEPAAPASSPSTLVSGCRELVPDGDLEMRLPWMPSPPNQITLVPGQGTGGSQAARIETAPKNRAAIQQSLRLPEDFRSLRLRFDLRRAEESRASPKVRVLVDNRIVWSRPANNLDWQDVLVNLPAQHGRQVTLKLETLNDSQTQSATALIDNLSLTACR